MWLGTEPRGVRWEGGGGPIPAEALHHLRTFA